MTTAVRTSNPTANNTLKNRSKMTISFFGGTGVAYLTYLYGRGTASRVRRRKNYKR
jgi:hypothetical protein